MQSTMRKQVILWAALIAFLAAGPGCPSPGTIVAFRDAGLEDAVRDALGQPFGFINAADMRRLTRLDARGREIRNLTGLEYAVNLTFLDLDTNDLSDLTPLANLTNLRTLILDSNHVFDIQPLAGLLNLDSLSLFDNQVGDIQALVANAANGGLGPGDVVTLDGSTMSDRALTVDIPLLEAPLAEGGYGVTVLLVEPAGGNE